MSSGLFYKFDRVITAFLKWTTAACLAGLLLLVGAGVFVRFVPIASMGWADEIIEFGFAWMIFFGAALLWRNRTHFRVDLLLQVVINFISLSFILLLAYEGSLLTVAAVDPSPILEWPKALWYAVIPISAIIMIVYTVRDILWLFSHGHVKEWKDPRAAERCDI